MSFSGEIKRELSCQLPSARHCRLAEISAVLSFCSHVEAGDGGNRKCKNAYGKSGSCKKKLYFIEKNV